MTTFRQRCRLASLATAAALAITLPSSVLAQVGGINLFQCEGLWFSTSEDFLSQRSGLPGGQVVSDGDLLTYEITGATRICARNEELLRAFDIRTFDHGLDALDRMDIDRGTTIAAFSTELDSINGAGQFTAGDLLFTNGAVIPNVALLVRFDLPRSFDMGLDGVHITGTPAQKRGFLGRVTAAGRDAFVQNPGLLIELLEAFDIDILFTTEGTAPEVQKPRFLDGDLLSARNGTIERSNADLFSSLPAGIPDRGVDYGLDAYTPAIDPIERVPIEILSTEIQARDRTLSDGDALLPGPGVYLRNRDLIANLEPRDSDMGLDALAAPARSEEACAFRITAVSHVDVTSRINPATGLFDGDRPFGRAVRVQGDVPGRGCPRYNTHEFQVRVSIDAAPEQPILHPASLDWMTLEPPCIGLTTPYAASAGGWFTLTQYQRVVDCPNDESLAVWQSNADVPNAVATATMRIVMRPIGGGPEVASAPVRIRIDNKRPEMLTMALYKAGETDPFDNQCKIDGEGEDVLIDIRGTFFDDHFRVYTLTWNANGNIGGVVPATIGHAYNNNPPDLTPTGTNPTPPDTNVLLEAFNLTAAFASHPQGGVLIECGYSILLRVFDRTRLGGMNWKENAFSIDDAGNRIPYLQSFCLVP